jgi:hypothetical protein
MPARSDVGMKEGGSNMRRRTLMILALSLMLVIPAVVAVAASGVDTVGTPAVTADRVQEQARDCGDCLYGAPERDQVRDRDQDQTKAPDVAGDRDQVQEQKQLRIHEPAAGEAGDQVQARKREQVRDQSDCDGDGLQLREQVRTEAQRELKLAEQKGYGPGAETGNGPMHEGPADGTGNQFGPGPGTGSGPLHEGPADGTGNQFGQGGR